MDKTPVDILTAIPAPYPDVTTRHDGETVEISFLRIRSARMQRLLGKTVLLRWLCSKCIPCYQFNYWCL